jgi:hypothetical protein
MRRIAVLAFALLVVVACGGTGSLAVAGPTAAPTATPPPHALAISAIQLRGSGNAQPDEYVELKNVVDVSVDLSGWKVVAGDEEQYFVFPASYVLAPGQTCRLYTNQVEDDSCGGKSFGFDRPIWDNDKDCGQVFDGNGALVSEVCRKGDEAPQTTPVTTG